MEDVQPSLPKISNFYSEHNCVDLAFGIESGSQKILDIMEKKFTKQRCF